MDLGTGATISSGVGFASAGVVSSLRRICQPPPMDLSDENQVLSDGALRHGQLIFLLGQQLLDVQHAVEVGFSLVVLLPHQIQRFLRRRNARGEKFHLAMGLQKADQRVLDFRVGLEHRVLIGDRELLELGVLNADSC